MRHCKIKNDDAPSPPTGPAINIMKILFFSPYFHPYISGLTQSPERVLTHLAKKNKVTVLTFPHQTDLKTKEFWRGMNIVRMPYWFKISKGYISPQSIIYFLNEVRNTDVVFINLPNAEGLMLAMLANLFRKKAISLFNCQVDLGPGFFNPVINFVLNSAVFFQLFLSDTIIAYPDYIEHLNIGKIFKDKIRETLPIIETPRPNKTTLAAFQKEKGADVWIGFAGRIAREKGIEYLIEAVESLRATTRHSGLLVLSLSNGPRIQLIFAGPPPSEVVGEDNYARRLIKLLDTKHISYKFLGRLSEKDLSAFYKSIDVLILPSINRTEAFGMVQAEAMLHGTPVIATSLPGVRIAISQTKMGVLVEPKNTEQIARAIENILKNKVEFTNADLIKKAKRFFNPKEIYRFYEEIVKR